MTAVLVPREAAFVRREAGPPAALPLRLYSLLYVSSATRPFSQRELVRLVAEARAWNALNGVTGVLLYRMGNFIQYLEGPYESIDALKRRIRRDPRHHGMVPILDCRIERRAFEGQALRFEDLDAGLGQGPRDAGIAALLNAHPPAPPPASGAGCIAERLLDRFRQHHHLRRPFAEPAWAVDLKTLS